MTALQLLRRRLAMRVAVKSPSGEILESTVPASTFYHLLGAVAALTRARAG
jgi:hypothetical protein